jgi:hypothetical protein
MDLPATEAMHQIREMSTEAEANDKAAGQKIGARRPASS